MKMTTDAGDKISLSDIVYQHGRDLQKRLDEAQKLSGSAGIREADGILQKLRKLSRQAGACGFNLDGSRQSGKISPELAELRATIAEAKRGQR